MVRAPARTCPNISRLFDEAEPELLSGFLKSKAFERLSWLAPYRFDPENPDGPSVARNMLPQEKKDRLGPLEAEAARIVTIASDRGEYVLEGLAKTTLEPERAKELLNRRDKLARSLWAYANEHGLFEAAENSLHLRLYRRYDKHYQTFMAEPSVDGGPDAGSALLEEILVTSACIAVPFNKRPCYLSIVECPCWGRWPLLVGLLRLNCSGDDKRGHAIGENSTDLGWILYLCEASSCKTSVEPAASVFDR